MLFLSKYNFEYKLKIVKSVLEDMKGIKMVAKESGVCKGDIQKWVAVYQIHGADGLVRKKSSYNGEFKQQVIEDMHKNKMSLRQVAAKYHLGHSTISNWEQIYVEEGADGLYIGKRGQTGSANGVKKERLPKCNEMAQEDLIAEVERLRAENDYLKKLNALVLEEERRNKRRR